MISTDTSYKDRLVFTGGLHQVMLLAGIGVAFICSSAVVTAIFDDGISTAEKLVLFAGYGIFGAVLLPIWMIRLAILVRVTPTKLTLQFWPFKRTRVLRSNITSAESIDVDTLKDFGGWGVRGTKRDQFYSANGSGAVRIEHTGPKGETRLLTVLTDHPNELVEALATKS